MNEVVFALSGFAVGAVVSFIGAFFFYKKHTAAALTAQAEDFKAHSAAVANDTVAKVQNAITTAVNNVVK